MLLPLCNLGLCTDLGIEGSAMAIAVGLKFLVGPWSLPVRAWTLEYLANQSLEKYLEISKLILIIEISIFQLFTPFFL